MNQLETIAFHGTQLPVVEVEGQPRVVVRHAFDEIGVQGKWQVQKLQKQPWADISSVRVSLTYAGQEQIKRVLTCDVRTFLMALAQIPVGTVAEHVRPTLVAYQCEVARVIENHFTNRGVQDPVRDPYTWDWDEVAALLGQRYGIDMDVNALLRALRDGGVLKKTNHPKKAYRDWFWFTGSAWNLHPHILPRLARKVAETRKVLGDVQAIQLELALNQQIGKELAA
ncbi:phage antirepressor N-terminal domain-containing protein [Corynebacterium mastitidis]|uniref:phage antirepressor N-terminal domain-containing protein n=1 Tax=Corynebacterium mastitidis TaxID=161890 RepID=UPI00037F010D|nr:phage antirepressor N-terminal domain-containing protein [Corynebacterium mastitidis]